MHSMSSDPAVLAAITLGPTKYCSAKTFAARPACLSCGNFAKIPSMLPFGVNGEDCGWSCWPGRGGVDGGGIWPAALQGGVGCRWPEERVGGCMYRPLCQLLRQLRQLKEPLQ